MSSRSTACGTLVVLGQFTRIATFPLLSVIVVALYSTKIVMLAKVGLWSILHDGRTDLSMLLALIFLALVSGGSWSLDARLTGRRGRKYG
jgi:putative oxidoreductase